MSIREKLIEFARKLDSDASKIATGAHGGTSAHERCQEYCAAMYRAGSELYHIARDESLLRQPPSPDTAQLRQAVKALTASSEQLRELNRKAVAKDLRQEAEIKRLRLENNFVYQCDFVRDLQKSVAGLEAANSRLQRELETASDCTASSMQRSLEIARSQRGGLLTQLERTEKQHQAALAANRQLEKSLSIERTTCMAHRHEIACQTDEIRTLNLQAKNRARLSDSDRQKLFSVCRTVTEVIAGRPAQPGDVLTIPTE